MIDTDNDNAGYIAYGVRFAAASGGAKTANVRHIEGPSYERTGRRAYFNCSPAVVA